MEKLSTKYIEAGFGEEESETTQESAITTQEKILQAIKSNPKITRNELAKKIGISPNGVKYHLANMKGVIKHVGSTKAGEWVIIKE